MSGIDPEILARAEAAAKALAAPFLESAREGIARHRAEFDASDAASARRLRAWLHDLEGQAATFGFPAIGAAALQLHEALRQGKDAQIAFAALETEIKNA